MLVMKFTLQLLGIGQKQSVITFLKHNCYPVENTRKLILLIKANLALFSHRTFWVCVPWDTAG